MTAAGDSVPYQWRSAVRLVEPREPEDASEPQTQDDYWDSVARVLPHSAIREAIMQVHDEVARDVPTHQSFKVDLQVIVVATASPMP